MAHPLEPSVRPLLDAVARHLAPDDGDFVGRSFLDAAVTEFAAVNNRMLVIVGPPGSGKTAYAADLVRRRLAAGAPCLAHFCELPDGDDPQVFCAGIGVQVQAALGGEYRLPQSFQKQVTIDVDLSVGTASDGARVTGLEIKQLNLGGTHPREAFRLLVREPLRAYDAQHGGPPGGPPLLVVIDGLDRAWEWDGGRAGNIVSVLADAQDLPPWVRLVCTARPGAAVQALRSQAGVRVFDVEPLGAQNLADIETYFRERLVGALDPAARGRLAGLLASAPAFAAEPDPQGAFLRRAVAASQGNFLFVRRYARELCAALAGGPSQPAADPAALLALEGGGAASLASALDATYQAILGQLRRSLDADPSDADEDVLAALGIAFAPLSLALLQCLTGRPAERVAASLGRLAPVLEGAGAGEERTYALYHRGFADFVRRGLPREGRDLDVQAARRLETSDAADRMTREYSGRYRWPHLLRGLAVAAPAGGGAAAAPPAAPGVAGASWQAHVEQIRAMAPDAVTQAQLLRALAAQATDRSAAETPGSWTAAVGYLKAAEGILRASRGVRRLARRGRIEPDGRPPPAELLELERVLVALGDAYTGVGRRMDGAGDTVAVAPGLGGDLYAAWSVVVRLPLTLYLLVMLLVQGVREVDLGRALRDLGRGQDWAVARLFVLAASVYRQAAALAHAHGAEATADEIADRLARVYRLIGAYDIAAARYEDLIARPAAAASPWRQAVWLLSLGETLVAQGKADRAAEVLSSALPTFEAQQAPVLKARALGALAAAQHAQAAEAARRGEEQRATALDDATVAGCGAALTAWFDVTTLSGDDLVSVDPGLATGRVAGILRRMLASDRLTDAQHRRATAELARVTEHHFPQRYEHPLLRLFRVGATVTLPAYILAALLLAVQQGAPTELYAPVNPVVQSPLLDLSSFPNNLVAGGTTSPSSLTQSDLAQLVGLGELRPVVSAPPPLPNSQSGLLSITWVSLGVLAVYMAIYAVAGLLIITLASPARYQHRRPGRVILRPDAIVLRGMVSRGTLRDAAEWLREGVQELGARARRRARRAVGLGEGLEAAPGSEPDRVVPLAEVERVTGVNRRAGGFLLGDFSVAVVQRREGAPVELPGTLVGYDDLGGELRARLGERYRLFSTEVVRSASGAVFIATLLYVLALVLLLPVAGAVLSAPLPPLGYSASDLYVLIAPGLLLPLLWWLVAQPLGALRARDRATPRLLATTAAGGALTLLTLDEAFRVSLLHFEPDLFTPTLAIGVLAALVAFALPRPLYRVIAPDWRNLLFGAVCAASLFGIFLLSRHVAVGLAWHDARVRGNALSERALTDPACEADPAGCPAAAAAERAYAAMVCLRPDAAEGYTLRAFARLQRDDEDGARADLEAALRIGGRGAPAPLPGCLDGGPGSPPANTALIHANLASIRVQQAISLPHAEAAPHFAEALRHYALALGRPEPPGDDPSCYVLARDLLGVTDDRRLDEVTPAPGVVRREQAATLSYLASACYYRGLNLAAELPDVLPPNRLAARQAIWADVTAAAAQFAAAAAATDDRAVQVSAARGTAASWLLLGQIDPPPAAADRRSYLLRAQTAYRALVAAGESDVSIYAGQAWSTILLDAWSDARAPLREAARMEPGDATYPAMLGYIAWLDSTRYPVPGRAQASPAYAAAIHEAIRHYTAALERSQYDRDRVYATRSTLYYSLRNTPRGAAYRDEDYGAWMSLAISDVDRALIEADATGVPVSAQVGYRYWRGRLTFSLALTWQRKLRGLHAWGDLIPLYARALEDFERGMADDGNIERRRGYGEHWAPWAGYMLSNAANMQIAEESYRAGDFARARRALDLVEPRVDAVRQRTWDQLAGPRPEYSLAHGLISLGLGRPEDFVNPLTGSSDPLVSYRHAIQDIETGRYVPSAVRAAIYDRALADLDALIERGGLGRGPRIDAETARAELRARRAAAGGGLSGAPLPNISGEPQAPPFEQGQADPPEGLEPVPSE